MRRTVRSREDAPSRRRPSKESGSCLFTFSTMFVFFLCRLLIDFFRFYQGIFIPRLNMFTHVFSPSRHFHALSLHLSNSVLHSLGAALRISMMANNKKNNKKPKKPKPAKWTVLAGNFLDTLATFFRCLVLRQRSVDLINAGTLNYLTKRRNYLDPGGGRKNVAVKKKMRPSSNLPSRAIASPRPASFFPRGVCVYIRLSPRSNRNMEGEVNKQTSDTDRTAK